ACQNRAKRNSEAKQICDAANNEEKKCSYLGYDTPVPGSYPVDGIYCDHTDKEYTSNRCINYGIAMQGSKYYYSKEYVAKYFGLYSPQGSINNVSRIICKNAG